MVRISPLKLITIDSKVDLKLSAEDEKAFANHQEIERFSKECGVLKASKPTLERVRCGRPWLEMIVTSEGSLYPGHGQVPIFSLNMNVNDKWVKRIPSFVSNAIDRIDQLILSLTGKDKTIKRIFNRIGLE